MVLQSQEWPAEGASVAIVKPKLPRIGKAPGMPGLDLGTGGREFEGEGVVAGPGGQLPDGQTRDSAARQT